MNKRSTHRPVEELLPEPVDVVDGIPDRSPRPARWKYVALVVVFVAWVALLVWCRIAGEAKP